MQRRAAFVELVKSTFNRRIVSPDRLVRQFEMAARISTLAAVRTISYPRTLERLADVRGLILADLARGARSLECAPC